MQINDMQIQCAFCARELQLRENCNCKEVQEYVRDQAALAALQAKYASWSRQREQAEYEWRRLDRECCQIRLQEQAMVARLVNRAVGPKTPKKEASQDPPEAPGAPKKQRVKK
jgi:hypothetical protein